MSEPLGEQHSGKISLFAGARNTRASLSSYWAAGSGARRHHDVSSLNT